MTVEQTSLLAFREVQQVLGLRQQQVYDAIHKFGLATDKMISDETHLPINCVTPRRLELADLGKIKCEMVSTSLDPPYRLVKWWRTVR
jgi:hypothetical protein